MEASTQGKKVCGTFIDLSVNKEQSKGRCGSEEEDNTLELCGAKANHMGVG
jgi:hypothetical protein